MRRVLFSPLVALVVFASAGSVAALRAQSGERSALGAPTAFQGAPAARGPQPSPPCGPNLPSTVKNVDKQSRCFELRIYTIREGGSMDLLHTRFRERSNALFKKHNMTVIGYWQPVAKPDTLVYILAFKDNATRDALWAEFNADPEWQKARTEMQVNIQVESTLMSATDYSPLK